MERMFTIERSKSIRSRAAPSKPANAKPLTSPPRRSRHARGAPGQPTRTHTRRGGCPTKENGYNEVAEQKGHPGPNFLRKFWGISADARTDHGASAVLRKYSDLAVGARAGRQPVLSFAAGASGRWRRGDARRRCRSARASGRFRAGRSYPPGPGPAHRPRRPAISSGGRETPQPEIER